MSHQVPQAGFREGGTPHARTVVLAESRATAPESAAASGGMDLFDLFAALRRQWVILVSTMLVFLAAAGAWAWSQTPLYTATAEVLITPRQQNLIGGGLISPGLSSELMMIESQARIIVSETVLRRVVRTEGLADDPEFDGTRPPAGLVARLRSLLGRNVDGQGESREEIALRTLMKRLRVRRAEKTFVLEISVTSEDPAKAARLANAIARAYIADQTDSKAATAGRVNSLLADRLEVLRKRLAEAEDRVETFKREHGIVATGKDQIENELRLKRLGEELEKARSRAAAARARADKVRAALRAGGVPEATDEAVRSPLVTQLRTEYARAAARTMSLAQTLGPKHPALLAARAREERIRRLIRDELDRIARTAEAEAKAADEEVKVLERNLEEQKGMVARINSARIRLRELQREAAARRKVYETFLMKSKESGEASKLQIPDARIISPALPPEYPSWPKKKLILGLAGFLGLGAGVALALLRDMGGRRRPGPADPGNRTTQPPLPRRREDSALPRDEGSEGDRHLRLATDLHMPALRNDALPPGTAATLHEAYEALRSPVTPERSRLVRAVRRILEATADWHVLAITTPARGHGGTTLAWALAAASARDGKRTLLVDANWCDPQLSNIFLPFHGADLLRVLRGEIRPESLVMHDDESGIAFLSLAVAELPDAEMRRMGAFREWLRELFDRYDRVFIDAPPVPEPDGPVRLSCLVDGVVLSAMPEGTSPRLLERAARLLRDSGIPCGMVWNAGHSGPGHAGRDTPCIPAEAAQ